MGFGGGQAQVGALKQGVTPIPVVQPSPVTSPTLEKANPPTLASASGVLANARMSSSRIRAAGGMGFDNTITTSPQGLMEKEHTAPSTLLGQ